MTKDQEKLLLRYTDDLSAVQTISHHDYVKADSNKVSWLLDNYHLIHFHDDPGTMYMIHKGESNKESMKQ